MDNANDIAHTIDPRKRIVISAILLISDFICLMSQTMMVTTLPVIQSDMHQAMTTVQWLTTGYTLLIGIVTPLAANLYEKFTNRQVFLGTIGIFTVGTLLGCVAQNFWMLLLARLIQAAAGGILMSFQMTTMVTIFPPEKRGTIMGISSLVVAFGPAIGPTLAGFILSGLGWRYLFILILPVMVIILVISAFVFPNYSQPREIKIDMLSVTMSLLGSGLALASLTVMQTQFAMGIGTLVVGGILVALFVRRQLHLVDPMLKVSIFKVQSFRLMTLIGIAAFMVLLGTEQMVSIFAQDVTHLTSMQAGMVLLLVLIKCNHGGNCWPFIPKQLVLGGTILMLFGTFPFVMIKATMSVWLMTTAYAVRMIGNALVFSPVMSEAFKDLAPLEVSHATSLNNALRQVFGSVSVTLLIVISEIPHSFVIGMRCSMWVTLILTVLVLILFVRYLNVKNIVKNLLTY